MNTNVAIGALAGFVIIIGGCTYYLTTTPPTPPVVPPSALEQAAQQQPTPVASPVAAQRSGPDDIYPDVPGFVDPDTSGDVSGTICNSAWSTKSIRPPVSVTDPIKTFALARYNQEHGTSYTKADGELDHLISLELGGAPADPNNLWLEPYNTTVNGKVVGARQKDLVENELHREVCSGMLTLLEAQHIIVTDWYAFFLQKQL